MLSRCLFSVVFAITEELTVENGKRGDTTLNVPYHEISLGDALDRGAFGEVYRGSWRGNEVAVKVCVFW